MICFTAALQRSISRDIAHQKTPHRHHGPMRFVVSFAALAVMFTLYVTSQMPALATEPSLSMATPSSAEQSLPDTASTSQQPEQTNDPASTEAQPQIDAPTTPDNPVVAASDTYPVLGAANALAVTSDGTVLYDKGADISVPMASTTKIMTAILALESGLPMDTPYTVSKTAQDVQSMTAGFKEGEVTTLGDMLRVMLAYSAGDAAYGIAECVSGSVDSFLALMNQRATELGLTGTKFTSPDGYFDADHYSTATDLFVMARHAMQMPLFRSIVGANNQTISLAGVQTSFVSTNWLLNSYPGAQGVKTGYTTGAGYCFVGEASRAGRSVYVVILGDETDQERRADTQALLDYAFSLLPQSPLINSVSLAATGYVSAGYRFGWTALTSPGSSLATRIDPTELTATTSRVNLGTIASMPGDLTGMLRWSDASSMQFSRAMTVTNRIYRTCDFGPFTSHLFYQLRQS